MATSSFSGDISRAYRRGGGASLNRLPKTFVFPSIHRHTIRPQNIPPLKTTAPRKHKLVVRLSSTDEERSPPKPSTVDVQKLVDFLYEDLPHLFDDQGIDRTAYDERVKFRDPITKHDSISGYLFNIAMLRKLFAPDFQLHWVKQTGPYEITTRWTMVMKFILLPWKPQLVFTGTSVMGINPETNKFCSHVDYWDSIENNEFFSLEGLLDLAKQLRVYKTPAMEPPKYQILKRTANYEVRRYDPFIGVEIDDEKMFRSIGFNSVAGFIFGKDSAEEKIPMTTPDFTRAFDREISKVSVQPILPSDKELNSLSPPSDAEIRSRKVEKVEWDVAAVLIFSGKPTEDIYREKEKALRDMLIKDGLKPKEHCCLARYNDLQRTWGFIMRNEMLIWLEEFSLD